MSFPCGLHAFFVIFGFVPFARSFRVHVLGLFILSLLFLFLSPLLCACYFVLDLSLSSLDGCGSCGFGFGSELGFCQLVEFVLSVIK